MSQLDSLFAQYGVEPFLEATSLLVLLLDQEGMLISWNPSFVSLKQAQAGKTRLRDCLVHTSGDRFTELLATCVQQRIRTKGELVFAVDTHSDSFVCLFIPLPGGRVLLIGEPESIHNQSKVRGHRLQRMS